MRPKTSKLLAVVVALCLITAGAVALSGCGEVEVYDSKERPPATLTLATYIGPNGISVSPRAIGAGPVLVVITNQKPELARLRIVGEQVDQTVAVNPLDTANIKLNFVPGGYSFSAGDAPGAQTRVAVGPPRPSAQNELLQP